MKDAFHAYNKFIGCICSKETALVDRVGKRVPIKVGKMY
jgi:hypothetical protein